MPIAEGSRTRQPHGNTFLYLLPCQDLQSNTLLRLCATKSAKKLFAERCGAVFAKQKFAPAREKHAGICGYGKSFSRRRGEFLFVKTCRVRLPSAIAEGNRTQQPHGNTFCVFCRAKTYKVTLCCVFALQNLLKNYLPRGAEQYLQNKNLLRQEKSARAYVDMARAFPAVGVNFCL